MKYEFSGTPGPWFSVEYAGYWALQPKPYYESIDLLNEDNFESGQAELNARLAAAAPDLLEALIEYVEREEQLADETQCGPTALWAKASAAIHKALNI